MSDLTPAFQSYRDLDPAAPEGDTLNLAWTRDERECLSIDLRALLAHELADEPSAIDRYLVRDPYGEAAIGAAVGAAFGIPWQGRVTTGAGVVSLLHGLAMLTSSATTRFVGDVYPDFPYWVARHRETQPVWFLERPSLQGDAFAAISDLATLCDDAARAGAIVIVDESNANYYPPSWSAVSLAVARDNLVVVRGFSKAYGLGGLRLGLCVAAPALTERIRGVIAPLLASSLSLRLGSRVLAAGDLAIPLRARVTAHKRETMAILGAAGIDVTPASEYVPYVLSSDDRMEALEARGVVGKRHPMWLANRGSVGHLYRLSVPLSEARLLRLRQLLS